MNRSVLRVAIILMVGIVAYTMQSSANAQAESSSNKQNTNDMKSFISIFEIPATDFARAVGFYQSILGVRIEAVDMQGTQMGLFPTEGQAVSGVITKAEGYEPSASGVIIYLNGGDDLQYILDKIEKNGGEIMVPKTLIDEQTGYFAMFLDTEGNRIGLHSPK